MTTSLLENQALLAKVQRIEAQARQVEQQLYTARGEAMRSLSVFGEVETAAAYKVCTLLGHWQRLDEGRQDKNPIFVALNSRGGSTVDLFALFDYLKWVQSAGHHVSIQVEGTAEKHAVTLLQSAAERIITPQSWLMLTEEDLRSFHGDSANSEEKIEFLRGLELQSWQLIADRSKVTLDEIKQRTAYGREWWIPAEEALELGLVDKIGTVGPVLDSAAPDQYLASAEDSLEVRRQKASIRKTLAEAALFNMQADDLQAMDSNQVLFFMPVTRETVLIAQKQLERLSRTPGREIEILINSPGGSVVDGLALIDCIQGLRKAGHFVRTGTVGFAASMGGFLLQAGDERFMGANARVLIHRVSRIFGGSGSQVADQREMMAKMEARAFPILAARSKMTVEQIRTRCEHRDWWLTAQEALELGFVDKIRA